MARNRPTVVRTQAFRAPARVRQYPRLGLPLLPATLDRVAHAHTYVYGESGRFDAGSPAFPNYYWTYWGPIVVGTLIPNTPVPTTGFNYYYIADSFDYLYHNIPGHRWQEALSISAAIVPPHGASATVGAAEASGMLFGISDSDALDVPPDFVRVVTIPVHLKSTRPSRTGKTRALALTPVAVNIHAKSTRPSRAGDVDTWQQALPAPLNDNFALATVIDPNMGGNDNPDLSWATVESGEPAWHTGQAALYTVWYAFTAPADGTLAIQFGPVNNGVDPYPRLNVGVYTGTAVNALTMVAELTTEQQLSVGSGTGVSNPSPGQLNVFVAAGTTVYVRLGPENAAAYSTIDPTTNTPYGPGPAAIQLYFTEVTQSVGGGSVVPGSYDYNSTQAILTPGTLDVTVGNLPPASSVLWSVDSPTATPFDATDADDTGAIIGLTLMIPTVLAAGAHTLYGKVSDGSQISYVFQVVADNAATTTGADVPAVLIPRTGVKRWVFQDPTGTIPTALASVMTLVSGVATYIVPVNPAEMNAPFTQKQITTETTVGVNGNAITWESNPQKPTLTFKGVILDGKPSTPTSHLSMLNYFLSLPYQIYIQDHFDRAWNVYFSSFQPVPQQSMQHPYRHTYDGSATCFSVVQL